MEQQEISYLRNAFEAYINDPADSEYQQAYLCALLDMYYAMDYTFMSDEQLDILEEQTQAAVG